MHMETLHAPRGAARNLCLLPFRHGAIKVADSNREIWHFEKSEYRRETRRDELSKLISLDQIGWSAAPLSLGSRLILGSCCPLLPCHLKIEMRLHLIR
jgi:hypothetical protein